MVGASHTFQFSARDLHGNVVSSGGGRFAAGVRGRATGTAVTAANSNSTSSNSTATAAAGVSSAAVTDFGNGTYSVTAVFHGSGLQYLSVYIAAANSSSVTSASLVTTLAADASQGAAALASASLPGSPYQVYVQQPNVCSPDDVQQTVRPCNWQNKQEYVFSWLPGRGPHDDVRAIHNTLTTLCSTASIVWCCCSTTVHHTLHELT
jgi:hypothetical protein